nr:MAG TPA: hypothetical protein [Caudoviricetes sp.]
MKKEKEPVEWDDLPEWAKMLFCIMLGIIGLLLGLLSIFGPVALALSTKTIWPLLLWSIPVGTGIGLTIYDET